MKYVLYVIFAIVAFLLFVPTTGTNQIRNLPLLIALLVIAAGFVLFALIRRVVLFQKIKKAIKKRGCEIIRVRFNPFAARLHGRYSVTFKRNGKIICARLLIKQIKYQRYHFESAELIEFYRSNRVVFQSTKIRGATVSDLVETKKVGRQPLKWEKADCNIIIFNKIPDHITDSKQKNLLVKGDKVCGTETYIADVESFLNFLDANDN
jgi:hypothetical protein